MNSHKKIFKLQQPEKASSLFKGWQETFIWSCLQNVMGDVYGDSAEQPQSAMAVLGDFCFLAGKPDPDLVLYKPKNCHQDSIIMVPQNDAWAQVIVDSYGEKAKKVIRYGTKKEPNAFDRTRLLALVKTLPKEYTIKMMDLDFFSYCKKSKWCKDWVSQYPDYETFKKYGLGVLIVKDGEVVSGASSYASYQGGIEVQIDTKKEYRRQGLACICGASLILACLERGWYPSWDAQNKASAALAQKLGYQLSDAYIAYEIKR